MTVTAIVPAYNEEKNIATVLRVLVASPQCCSVIVVDDGSSDRTGEVARSAGARVIRQENQGKAAAMAAGARATNADILFFADADLVGFSSAHLEALLAPVCTGRAGMTIGLRDRGSWMWWPLEHILPRIGGERAIRRDHFLSLIRHRAAERFGVETVMNVYCTRYGIPVMLVRMHGVTQVIKERKYGFWRGFAARSRMIMQIVKAHIAMLGDKKL